MSLKQDAEDYWRTISGPANAWGQHVHPKYGQSHHMLAALRRKHGSELFDIALDRTHPYKKKEVTNEHP
jgi:hypothetical protein